MRFTDADHAYKNVYFCISRIYGESHPSHIGQSTTSGPNPMNIHYCLQ